MQEKQKYYRLDRILKENAVYNMIIGERSNGKTYACLEYGLKDYIKNKSQMAIIRRYEDDFRNKRGQTLFDALVENGVVTKLTKGEYTGIVYESKMWYLCYYDEELKKKIKAEEPFAYAFALSTGEHDKSTSYPKVSTILFDEFLTRYSYLPDEFVLFQNTLSTIIRDRDNVKIFMCANTVNRYSVYFTEMGLTRIDKMEKGTIDLYTYGNTKLSVAVEYCATSASGKKSDKYFAFDNPRLKMITEGSWEIDIYPHLPVRYKENEVKFRYFIKFNGYILQCNIIKTTMDNKKVTFTYVHRKTTDIKNTNKDIIYDTEYNPKDNYSRNIKKIKTELNRQIYRYYQIDKVFYQDNEVGEIMRNYLQWCDVN